MIASALRWVLYAVVGVVATCALLLATLIGGNALHLWGQQSTVRVSIVHRVLGPQPTLHIKAFHPIK
jgi:hypothetical protein